MSSVSNEQELLILDKAQGAMVGLALGDALGTSLEFRAKDSYTPLVDIVGGGHFIYSRVNGRMTPQ